MKMPWSKSAPVTSEAPAPAPKAPEPPRDPTAPKGRPTPRQTQRRGPVEPPPQTSKEARARMREQNRERKAAGLQKERPLSAREERMQARDAGPERELVRNLVDTRRSISSAFPLFAILILVAMFSGLPSSNPEVYNYISYAWLAFFAVIIFESIFLGRVIGREVRARFPKTTIRMGSLKYYGIIRGLMFRRLRFPKPVLRPGDEV
ncbi:MAG: DUF3043 domain-containing protein [Cumulibacter sp.]|uniref:DUF3043 domain-containing protein n=1 Tax=Cumulibacter soli TaxID=2546344 RepID=UPI001067CA50|nr:DUF3043 domain-containing protein [Cumulibacter soli]